MSHQRSFIDLDHFAEEALIAGARDSDPVRGLTHGFYKYPARFSPTFVRAALEAFTRPGDYCFDPHVGGGTTLVEAIAMGRHAIGIDISTLAEFVSSVKTTVFSERELNELNGWASRVPASIDIHKRSTRLSGYDALGYYKHLDHPMRWRLRKAIEQGLTSTKTLSSTRLESFGRCAVLRTAQWALDGRMKLPSIEQFRKFLGGTAFDMIEGAKALRVAVRAHPETPRVRVFNRSAAGVEEDGRFAAWRKPKLILTSPPYPGVHVLYHRFQVDGRKESPLPFMIAGKLDGAGGSYYTMGDRKNPQLATYFESIKASMSSVTALADRKTTFVQMVAFHEPSWQLPRYLQAMREAGLEEVFLPSLQAVRDGRLWRTVPSRRWYSEQRGQTPASQEVVLLHRKAKR